MFFAKFLGGVGGGGGSRLFCRSCRLCLKSHHARFLLWGCGEFTGCRLCRRAPIENSISRGLNDLWLPKCLKQVVERVVGLRTARVRFLFSLLLHFGSGSTKTNMFSESAWSTSQDCHGQIEQIEYSEIPSIIQIGVF